MKRTDKLVKDYNASQHEQAILLTERNNDEKLAITLLIVGTGMIAYYFWKTIKESMSTS